MSKVANTTDTAVKELISNFTKAFGNQPRDIVKLPKNIPIDVNLPND